MTHPITDDLAENLQARAPVQGEPVYWEWRHLSTHPDTVDFGKWSEWKRVEARSAIHTIDDELAEFRTYIAQGHKYELRALYTTTQPATGEPVVCATPDGLKSNWHAHHAIVNKAALQMVRNALRNDVERGLKVRGEMLAELDSATFQAHPAQDVPDDVVRDAAQEAVEELHKLNEYAIVCINDPEWTRVSDTCQKLIGSIDAAMLLAAKETP